MSDFCKILESLARYQSDRTPETVRSAIPEPVYRAYVDLVTQAFIYIRSCVALPNPKTNELRDLADALHNVSGILVGYGCWVDDAKYRELYLRPFDATWANGGFGTVSFVDARIAHYTRNRSEDA